MQFDTKLSTPGHEAEWLENAGKSGLLQFVCNRDGEDHLFVEAGWDNLNYCPVCGEEIELTTEEL